MPLGEALLQLRSYAPKCRIVLKRNCYTFRDFVVSPSIEPIGQHRLTRTTKCGLEPPSPFFRAPTSIPSISSFSCRTDLALLSPRLASSRVAAITSAELTLAPHERNPTSSVANPSSSPLTLGDVRRSEGSSHTLLGRRSRYYKISAYPSI